MDYYPLFANLKGQSCVVVGAGSIATRKLEALLKCGAKVTVVAPQSGKSFETFKHHSMVEYLEKDYEPSDLNNAILVVAATNLPAVNTQVSADAQKRNLLCNVVDEPELCSYIMPSIVDRSPVTIAISTGGTAPVLARLLRGKLESLIPAAYGNLAQFANNYRDKVKRLFSTTTARKNTWEKVFEGDVAEHIFNNDYLKAERSMERLLKAESEQSNNHKGEIYLVGAGPGDADLLTFRALRVLQKADVVLYDRLVSNDILELIRRDADKIYVGKQRSNHCVPQEGINQLLIDLALEGKRVVRLKGGDPYIFGRGGEEAQDIVKAGIPFQVIPGITSASGASSYCGIPLTHRDHAQSVTYATGHLKNDTVDLDWPSLAKSNNTLVIYMGIGSLPIISAKLIEHGLRSTTSVAVVQNATRSDQKMVIGDLTTIALDVERAKIESPAIIIIGDVVNLAYELNPELNELNNETHFRKVANQ